MLIANRYIKATITSSIVGMYSAMGISILCWWGHLVLAALELCVAQVQFTLTTTSEQTTACTPEWCEEKESRYNAFCDKKNLWEVTSDKIDHCLNHAILLSSRHGRCVANPLGCYVGERRILEMRLRREKGFLNKPLSHTLLSLIVNPTYVKRMRPRFIAHKQLSHFSCYHST